MRHPIAMPMFRNAMMFLAGGVERIDVNDGIAEGWHVMQKLMPHVRGNGMPLGNRQFRTDGDIEFRMQPMPQPSGTDLCHLLHLGYVPRRVPDFLNEGWLHPIEQAREDRLCRLPDNAENDHRDQQSNQRINLPGTPARRRAHSAPRPGW